MSATAQATSSRQSTPAPDPRFMIGKYRLLAELGRGGMATAYLAASQGPGGFNKLVVVKKLRAALAAEPEFLRMFLDEAKLAARITHPNVVQTHEVGVEPPNCYIAMEYLEGQAFETVLRRAARRQSSNGDVPSSEVPSASGTLTTGALPLKFQLQIICNALAGLDHAHELKDFDGSALNVVHRDVSPHNLMVTYDGHVKLLDFGIAKAADSSGDTRTGVMKGKCAYMPAEQFGGKDIDRRADVFAVGVILWQALTGRRLWRGLSDAEIFQKVAMGDVPAPRSVNPAVDPELEAIALKSLAHDRENRYATAADMQAALEDYISRHPEVRTNAKELGRYVAELFSDDRIKLKSIIESALKTQRAEGILNLADGVGNTRVIPNDAPSVASLSGTISPAATQVSPIDVPPSKARLWIFGAVGAVAAAAIVGAVTYKPGEKAPSIVSPIPSAPTTSAVTNEQCALTLRAKPATAKLYLDGNPLSSNPASVVIPRGNSPHIFRAEAEGYVAAEEPIIVDVANLSRELTLAPQASSSAAGGSRPIYAWPPSKASASSTASVAPPSVVTVATPTPSATSTGRHGPVDKGDPWDPKR